MKEEFKPIVGFEELYEVSNLGNVYSLNYNGTHERKMIKPSKNKDGYKQCILYIKGKQYSKKVHRLVAETFIENPNNLPQVNHKDENKENNCVDNLEWCSIKYNANYGNRNKKISNNVPKQNKPVCSIDNYGNIIKKYNSIKEAEEDTKIKNIGKCCRNERKTAGGLIWKFL